MKTLHLIRHAKSSWDYPHLSDHQRPLNKRGNKDAALMAGALFNAGIQFPAIYCSSATRAQQTIQGIYDNWPGQAFNWQVDEALYEFSESNLKNWLNKAFQYKNELMVVSHNPSLTNLINSLCRSDLYNFPTCAYAQIRFKELDVADGELMLFLKPKIFK